MSMPDRSTYTVFISYSRRDADFVRQLFDRLSEKGQRAWVDWRGIDFSTKWWEEICDGIERADNFVFVVSPDSLNSEHCHREIAHARQHSKRIIPFIYRETDESQLVGGWYKTLYEYLARDNWEQLKTIQFISLSNIGDFDKAVDALIYTVDTDPQHLRMHTRLVQRASEWERREHNLNFLLRGDDLATAEYWLKSSKAKDPIPSDLQSQYITASRQHEDQLQREADAQRQRNHRLTLAAIIAVIIGALAIAATVYTGLQVQRAEKAGTQAASAQTQAAAVMTQTQVGRNQLESQRLASLAQQVNSRDQILAIRLALEANFIDNSPPIAQQTLREIAYFPGPRRTFSGHEDIVFSGVYGPDGQMMLSGSQDRTLKLWDVTSGEILQTFSGHKAAVFSGAYGPDGTTVLSGSWDTTLKLWDVASGEVLRTFSGHQDAVFGVAYSPDGATVLSGSRDTTLKLWDVASGEVLRTFSGHQDVVSSVAYSPDGRTVLSGSRDTTVKLWDVASGEVLHTFSGHQDAVFSVAYSPDGRTVLSGSRDTTLKLWDVASGEVLHTFSGHEGFVSSGVYSPDGTKVLSGSEDGTLKLWDVASGEVLHSFSGHADTVDSVAYSPDGQTVLSGSYDRTLKLWNVTSGEVVHTSSGHKDIEGSTTSSPDGQLAETGNETFSLSQDDSITELINWIYQNREVRTLTCSERQVYSITPLCIDGILQPGGLPTLTPYPTLTPIMQTWTPIPTATIPVWTPLPTLSASNTLTP